MTIEATGLKNAAATDASRSIAATLALMYDWLFPRLDTDQTNLLLGPTLARTTDMSAVMGFAAFHELLSPAALAGFAIAVGGVYFGTRQ